MLFVPDHERPIRLLELQLLYQHAVIQELALEFSIARDQIQWIEDESDIPAYDRNKLRGTLKIHYSNLSALKQQIAIYAGTPPLELINRVNIIEMEIDDIERRLKSG